MELVPKSQGSREKKRNTQKKYQEEKEIVDYILIKNDRPSYLEKEVSLRLATGYELVGGPVVNSTGMIMQAMVKKEK